MSEGPIHHAARPSGAVWWDDAPVGGHWPPPGPARPPTPAAAPSPARIPPAAVYGIIVVALALVVASVWGLGGLEKRTDTARLTAPGALITTGPYELTFTEVTAQRSTSFDKSVYWKLTMVGSGRTTGSATIAPSWSGGGGMFISRDDATREVEAPSGANFGADRSSAAAFTPGLAAVPYTVEFKYRESYRPGPTLRVLVFDLDYYDNSLLGDGDKAWHNTEYSHQLLLPVRVLPDATY